MKKIVLIGAGQLGSRHLQSLSLLEVDTSIEVVDPSDNSLELAKKRFEEMPYNCKIKVQYLKTIEEASSEIDLCIVATTANIRAQIIRNILYNKKNVKSFILEKVLFQKISDFNEIELLLEKNKIKCWVNHPFRSYPFYKELKKYFLPESVTTYQVIGGNWGLACNGLHYIDHLAFLTNNDDIIIDASFLDRDIIKSKREGFIELSGRLIGKLGANNFILQNDNYNSPLTITIQNENLKVILDEVAGWIKIAKKENHWEWEYIENKIMYFQSELTHLLVKDIFEKNTCDLPSYGKASKLHKPFLKALLNHQNLVLNTPENDICPIT